MFDVKNNLWRTVINKKMISFISDYNNKEISNHPLIVFYNEYDDRVYYLQGQTFDEKRHIHLINQKRGVLIKKPIIADFIKQDTIFDCTTIYSCDLDDFIKHFDIKPTKRYYEINVNEQKELITTLFNNTHINKNIALKEVGIEYDTNDGMIKQTSEYSYISNKYLQKIIKHNDKLELLNQNRDVILSSLKIDILEDIGYFSQWVGVLNSCIFEYTKKHSEHKKYFLNLQNSINTNKSL